ncbi:hypothetical protein G2W53_040069 [Senna tora]|uniref:Uncharacterized protein n=1 Tax=Senna tora TaxID=362788 RepID=A0A834SNU9_9FABA|nr:hypothetical protein G2W53_040069 [Senna tora]
MMRRRHSGRAIRRVIMNHQSNGRARVDLLSNKCIPSASRDKHMTTGRINQVAILFRHVAPPTPLPVVMPGRSLHDEGNRLPRILSYIKGTCKGINHPLHSQHAPHPRQ